MTTPERPRPARATPSRARWAVICALLAPAVVVPLLVPVYDRTDPELWGFPFYYWFQFALIPMAAVLTFTAYQLSKPRRTTGRTGPRSGR